MKEGIHLDTKDILKTAGKIAITGALLQLAGTAFSRPVRREIMRRANNSSEVSHRNDRPLEASHINHSREFRARNWQGRKVEYNSDLNGLMMTDIEHQLYHEDFLGSSHLIGLTEDNNMWAIQSIGDRIRMFNEARGIEDITDIQREIYTDEVRYKVQEHCRREGLPDPYKQRAEYLNSLGGLCRNIDLFCKRCK